MRGKKYKSRDKTVKKSSRSGLTEVNLHSHKSVKISSREPENLIRKEPDSVNVQKTYRQRTSRAAGKQKSNRRRTRTKSLVKLEENTGRQIQNPVHTLKTEKESAAARSHGRPPYDRSETLFYGQEDGKACGTEKNFGNSIVDESGRIENIRTADCAANAMQSENKETEDSSAAADGMDERPDSGHCHDNSQILKPVHRGRGENLQRQIFQQPARSEKIWEQSGRREQKKADKRSRRKENAGQYILREEKTDGRRKKHSCRMVKEDDRPDEQSGCGGNQNKNISVEKGTETDNSVCGSDFRQEIISHSGGQRKICIQEVKTKQRTGRLILTAKKKQGNYGQDLLKNETDRRDTEAKDRAMDAAGSSESGSRIHDKKRSRTNGEGRKKSGRLIFEDKDNGMVRGAGLCIVKRAAPSVYHTVEESGNMTAEDDAAVEGKNRYRVKQVCAAAGLRNTFRCSARSALYRHPCLEENRAGMQMEKKEQTAETTERKKSLQGHGTMQGSDATDKVRAEKKASRRQQQKQRNKRAYQAAARRSRIAAGGKTVVGPALSAIEKKVWTGAEKRRPGIVSFFKGRKNTQWVLAAVFLFFMAVMSLFSSCSILFQGASGIAGTTYPSSDEDIYAVEAGYLELEHALDEQINRMESAHPGYDEYRYQIDEITHNPYHLVSYLTVVCPGFTYEQADGLLQELLDSQYRLLVEERTELHMDPDSGESYEWRILCISLTNRGLDAVAHERLTPEQEELYKAYNLTFGNRSYLFGEEANNGGGFETQVPGDVPEIPNEALSDQRFANMLDEAKKYLGYPYVWGGSSPQTSFDCSGFVSWVINHCGNGWNVGRQTAEGLRGCCTYVSPQEARPGDLIFFQGTYQTAGASHVGIYVGNNRMLHCGNPIQFTELGAYWQQHFLAYGRLP